MTENQFYALIAVIGSGLGLIGAAIRFSAARIVQAMDLNTKAMIENTKSNAVLATKIDGVADFVHKVESGPTRAPRAKTDPST